MTGRWARAIGRAPVLAVLVGWGITRGIYALFTIKRLGLNYDECGFLGHGLQCLEGNLSPSQAGLSHGPVLPLVLALVGRVLPGLWPGRLVPLLIEGAAIVGLTLAVRRMAGRRIALGFGAIVLASPILTLSTFHVHSDVPTAALVFCAVMGFALGSPGWLGVGAICATGAGFFKAAWTPLIPLAVLVLGALERFRARRLLAVTSIAIGAVTLGRWLSRLTYMEIASVPAAGGKMSVLDFYREAIVTYFLSCGLTYYGELLLLGAGVVLLAGLWSGYVNRSARAFDRPPRIRRLLRVTTVLLVLAYGYLTAYGLPNHRYVVLLLFPAALLAAAPVGQAFRSFRPWALLVVMGQLLVASRLERPGMERLGRVLQSAHAGVAFSAVGTDGGLWPEAVTRLVAGIPFRRGPLSDAEAAARLHPGVVIGFWSEESYEILLAKSKLPMLQASYLVSGGERTVYLISTDAATLNQRTVRAALGDPPALSLGEQSSLTQADVMLRSLLLPAWNKFWRPWMQGVPIDTAKSGGMPWPGKPVRFFGGPVLMHAEIVDNGSALLRDRWWLYLTWMPESVRAHDVDVQMWLHAAGDSQAYRVPLSRGGTLPRGYLQGKWLMDRFRLVSAGDPEGSYAVSLEVLPAGSDRPLPISGSRGTNRLFVGAYTPKHSVSSTK